MAIDHMQRFRANFRYALRIRGAKTRLAAEAGLTTVYLSNLAARQSTIVPSLQTALAICRFTGYSIAEYLLLPANFVRVQAGERSPISVAAFLSHLADYLEGRQHGIKQIVATEAGITAIYLSRLLRAAREHEETDVSLKVALAISQAIDVPLDRMCCEPEAARR